MLDSRGETSNNKSLVDDNTTLMKLTKDNFKNLMEILDKFGSFSGLKCNYDKTMVMPVGSIQEIPDNLHGFALTNKIKLLGADIMNKWSDLENNFT